MPNLLPTLLNRALAPVLAVVRHGNSPQGKYVILVIVLVAAFFALIVSYSAWREKKRTRQLNEIAGGLGFEFFPKGDADYFASLNSFPLIAQHGRQKKLTNLLRGKSRSFEVGIFDYSYVTGSGKSTHTWRQTVLGLQTAALALPGFTLFPKSLWNTIGSLLGHHDIEFNDHPAFSKLYVLRGNDADAIRKVFTDDVLQFFEEHPALSVQGSGDRLLLFKNAKRAKPDQISSLMEDGLKLLSSIHTTG